MTHARLNTGFTLIELMLSMSFVAMLLIAIAGTTMEIMSIYTKGLTIREVNQTGRMISEDMQRTVATTAPFKASPANQSDSKYITRTGGGRLCTGAYTYAWNYGKTRELSGNGGLPSVYNRYVSGRGTIRLVKVSDTGGILCANPSAAVPDDRAKELLVAGDRNLAVQQLIVTAGARDDASGQAIYAISLTLGTNDTTDRTLLVPNGTTCVPPNADTANDDFCAVNQFDIVVRAGNRPGSQ
jgi:hypothetical protein